MRILLVDDHAMVREGVRRILVDELAAAVFGHAATAVEAVDQVRRAPWDVILLDLSLPGRGGLETLKDIHEQRPGVPVVVMTMHSAEQYATRAFRAGAAGFVNKGSSPEELVAAVRKVLTGGKYVSAEAAEYLAGGLGPGSERPLHESLSDRELQVLRMLAAGKTVKQVGEELSLSAKTVSTYRTRVLEKLRLRTTAQLVRYAVDAGLADGAA
jgi:two-component system invasion response regulator UvrY